MDQAKKVTLYRPGPGRDLTDVTFEIEMRDLAYECNYDFDDAGDSVRVNFNILFLARRGPAAENGRVEVPYFSAVTNASRPSACSPWCWNLKTMTCAARLLRN